MTESLMFALLGFLVACFFGTVFANFLWRRAVTVTTRRLTENSGESSNADISDLQADIRDLRRTLSDRDREVRKWTERAEELQAAQSEAEENVQGATASLTEELKTATEALDAANRELNDAKSTLTERENELAAARERIGFLETAIRSLAESAAVLPPKTAEKLEKEEDRPQETVSEAAPAAGFSSSETGTAGESPERAPAEPADEAAAAVDMTRSLEERIEALKQGQPAH